MQLKRTRNYDAVRRILTMPDIYPLIGDDYTPPVEEFVLNDHPAIRYITASNESGVIGLFSLFPENAICWQLHVVMLPCATTREKWEAARLLPRWLEEHTECLRVTAAVPSCNRSAIVYGTHGIGMRHVGRHTAAFQKNGELQDLILLGLSVGDCGRWAGVTPLPVSGATLSASAYAETRTAEDQ